MNQRLSEVAPLRQEGPIRVENKAEAERAKCDHTFRQQSQIRLVEIGGNFA